MLTSRQPYRDGGRPAIHRCSDAAQCLVQAVRALHSVGTKHPSSRSASLAVMRRMLMSAVLAVVLLAAGVHGGRGLQASHALLCVITPVQLPSDEVRLPWCVRLEAKPRAPSSSFALLGRARDSHARSAQATTRQILAIEDAAALDANRCVQPISAHNAKYCASLFRTLQRCRHVFGRFTLRCSRSSATACSTSLAQIQGGRCGAALISLV